MTFEERREKRRQEILAEREEQKKRQEQWEKDQAVNRKITKFIVMPLFYLWIIFIIGCLIFGRTEKRESGTATTATCGVCDRQFRSRDNVRSIRNTNMCKNCYENFQWRLKIQEDIDD